MLLKKGYLKAGERKENKPQKYIINYLTSGTIEDIEKGKAVVDGYDENGAIIAHYESGKEVMPKTNWNEKTHNANAYGSKFLRGIFGNRFDFPKSLYAVHDTIRFFVANKPRAVILDFFAGSGTTLHAVNLLNAEDGGERRCILVTNNEVSDAEAKSLTAQGHRPGDPAWEALGIARYVTWPRTVCSMEGHDISGSPLKGEYLGTDRPMADGFPANAVYFKLGFLDKTSVSLGRQFRELLPLLWMKAGPHGPCPAIPADAPIPPMLILPENHFAVLTDETAFPSFEAALRDRKDIHTAFLITDYEETYRTMISHLLIPTTYQLYKDYLDNFRINSTTHK